MRPLTVAIVIGFTVVASCGGSQQRAASDTDDIDDSGHGTSDDGLDYDPENLVRFELWANTAEFRPDEPAVVGAVFHISEGWHIYWVNPGDSGLATRISVERVPGVTLGAPQFPGPIRFDSEGDIRNYGYKDRLIVPISATVTGTPAGPIQLRAKATWLACREDACVPGDGQASLTLPGTVSDADIAAHGARIAAALALVPRPVSEFTDRSDSSLEVTPGQGQAKVRVRGPDGAALEIFPLLDAAIADVARATDGSGDLRFALKPQGKTLELAVLSVRTGSATSFYSITSALLATR